jgi:hypothetical protein
MSEARTNPLRTSLVPRWLASEHSFTMMFLVLAVSVAVSYASHRKALDTELQFFPPENAVIVATGPIASLWGAVSDHFGDRISSAPKDDDQKKGLASILAQAQQSLKESHVPINQISDFTKYGVDIRRGVLASMHRATEMSPILLAVPVIDRSRFLEAFKKLNDVEKATEVTVPGLGSELKALQVSDSYVIFPQPDLALVSSHIEMLARSLRDRRANLEYFRRNDPLYDALRQCLGQRLATGATVFAFVRPEGVPGVRDACAGLTFAGDAILLKAEVGVDPNTMKVVNDLLADPPPDANWPSRLPHVIAGAFTVQERSLARLVNTLDSTDFRDVLEKYYFGFLSTLRDMPSFSRLTMAVTGYHDGLPDVLTGLWGKEDQVDARLRRLRLTVRRSRDIEILTAARAAAASIEGEAGSTFAKYVVQPDGSFKGGPQLEDLEDGSYSAIYEGRTIRYVAPAVTVNDRRFRKGFQKTRPDNSNVDRYRVAYIAHGDATWLATDIEDLKSLLDREQGDDVSSSPYFVASTRDWRRTRDKLELFLNVDQISRLGLLSPESAVEDFVKDYLLDLRDHPALGARLRPCDMRQDCLSLSLELRRRAAIR